MSVGLGFALQGATEGMTRRRNEIIQDEERDRVKANDEYVSGRRAIEDPMKDQVNSLRLSALERDDEIASIMQESRISNADINAQTASMEAVSKNINTQYKSIFETLRVGGGPAAASLFNDVKSNGVTNAADVVQFKDAKTGKNMIKFVDAEGNTVSDPNHGEAVFDYDELNTRFGTKPQKGRYSQSDGVVLDTATGATKGASGLPGGTGARGSKVDKEMRLRVQQGLGPLQGYYGGKLEGGIWFPEEGNKDQGLDAQSIMEHLVRNSNQDPVKAGRTAVSVTTQAYTKAAELAQKQAEKSGNDEPDQVLAMTNKIAKQIIDSYLGGSAGKKPGSSGGDTDKKQPTKKHIDALKKDSSPEMRKFFDEAYGAGAADAALGAGATNKTASGKGVPVVGSGGSKATPGKTDTLASDVENLKFKVPGNVYDNSPEGSNARDVLNKEIEKAVDAVLKKKGNGTLKARDKGIMKLALNGDISDDVKRYIVNILKRSK